MNIQPDEVRKICNSTVTEATEIIQMAIASGMTSDKIKQEYGIDCYYLKNVRDTGTLGNWRGLLEQCLHIIEKARAKENTNIEKSYLATQLIGEKPEK